MTELLSGLTAPGWWRNASGLWLPSSLDVQPFRGQAGIGGRYKGLLVAERGEPMEGVAAFATPEFVGQSRLGLVELKHLIGRLPQEDWLRVISRLQACLWAIQTDVRKHFELAEEVFAGTPAWSGIKAFLQNGEGARVPFSEQGLTLLQWLVIVTGKAEPSRDLSVEDDAALRMGLLGIASHVDVHADQTASRAPEDWLYYLTQNFAFNAKPSIANALGRTWQIYGRLARELGEDDVATFAPIDRWFDEDYGLSVEQQLALGFGLHAHLRVAEGEETGGHHEIMVKQELLDDLFRRLGLTETQQLQATDLISAPITWYQAQVGSQTISRASWDQVPLQQRPFLRLDGGRYLLLNPRGLESWFSDGLFYRGLECARRRGARAVSDFTAYVGHLTEAYALGMTQAVHREPRLPHAGRVYGDRNFGHGSHSSDIAVAYPNELAVIEVASRRFSVASRCDGDPSALRRDLQEMVGRRVGQLDRSVDAIVPRNRGTQATLRYPGVDPHRLTRIWPLVLTAIPLTWTSQLAEFLGEENPGALEQECVEELDILCLEDFEALLAIVENTGLRLVDLLKSKREVAGPHADVRRWLRKDRTIPRFARPRYLSDAYEDACDAIQVALGFESGYAGGAELAS
jgi:hypothetical protein